jgi:hypothetical protein
MALIVAGLFPAVSSLFWSILGVREQSGDSLAKLQRTTKPGTLSLLHTEGLETLSLGELFPHELCNYCSSIPFNLLGFHGKIRMEELDKHFPQDDRPLTGVFKNLNRCFFYQKIALIFQGFNRQNCGNLPLSKLGLIMVDILPDWLHNVEKDDSGHREGRLLHLGIECYFVNPMTTFTRQISYSGGVMCLR